MTVHLNSMYIFIRVNFLLYKNCSLINVNCINLNLKFDLNDKKHKLTYDMF